MMQIHISDFNRKPKLNDRLRFLIRAVQNQLASRKAPNFPASTSVATFSISVILTLVLCHYQQTQWLVDIWENWRQTLSRRQLRQGPWWQNKECLLFVLRRRLRRLALFSRYRGMIKRQISAKIVLIKSLCSKDKRRMFLWKTGPEPTQGVPFWKVWTPWKFRPVHPWHHLHGEHEQDDLRNIETDLIIL